MADLLFTYLRIGLMGSVMILAVLLLRPLLCKAPRNISCVLWVLVILRLLLPFQLESPLSLQPQQLTETTTVTQWAETVPAPDVQPVQLEDPVIQSKIQPETLAAIVWSCGILAIGLYVSISYCLLQYRVRDAVRSSDGTWESDRIGGAFLLGYLKPRTCLPTGLSNQDRQFILAHENAHRQRGDHWWKLLGVLALSIHWYNPLVWLAYVLLCRDIEVACDQRVIRTMALEERKSYSFALLNSGKRLSGFLAYPVAFGEISLKSRIKNVLNYRKPSLCITAIALVITATVAICFMTTPEATATYFEPEQPLPVVEIKEIIPTEPVTEPEPAPELDIVISTDLVTEPETPISVEPIPEIPPEPTVPTKPKTPPAEPKQLEVTQTATTETETVEIVLPPITDIDFSKVERVDTIPQFPTFDPPIEENKGNTNSDDNSGGISLVPKEPVKTGVELPSVSWDVTSPQPGYPALP